jgi:TRAP transporter TAXI family solute receptor
MKVSALRIGRRELLAMAGAGLALPRIGMAQEPPRAITIIGRGSAGSTSDLAFTVMEEAIKRAFAPHTVAIRRLPGTATAVPPRIESGEAQIGHGVGESVVDAWTATRTFNNRPPMRRLRYLGNYLGFLTRPTASPSFIVRDNSPIRSWADLRNRRIGVGTPDSLTSTMVNVALRGVGLSYDAIRRNGGLVATGDWNQQMDMLGDGQLDAVFLTADHPSPILTQFAANHRPRLVDMDEPVLQTLMESYPTFTADTMPPGTYEWQRTPVRGVRLSLGYVVDRELPDHVVTAICRQLYAPENAGIWGEVVPTWRGAERLLDKAAATVFIPLHPAARRFYEEAGIPITTIARGGDSV